ncbi:MAG: MATE family efflux transporter [Melioribacteraceae bacterium]|nr:MATE family efflux transporter [Melioribacteraceae bacterium]
MINFLSYKYDLKETIKLAYPVSIGQLGHILIGVVDSLMVGKLGAVPLAAASLVNGLFFLIFVFGIGMSFAITPLVAIALGENDKDKCGIILRQGLIVCVITGALLNVAAFFVADLVIYLDQPEEVAVLAKSYLQILSFSMIPFMIFQSYRQFTEGLSDPKPAMFVALSANVVNAFGNWILIFGNLGAPAMGLDGAGYASLITRFFMPVVLMTYVINSQKYSQFDPSLKFRGFNKKVIRKIVAIGMPSGFQYFFEVAAFAFAAIMIGWLGAYPLAAHQIGINLASVTYMIILGISTAASVRVANAFGRKDKEATRKAGLAAEILGGGLMLFFGIQFILFRDFYPTLYIQNPEVIEIASSLLIVAAFFQISDGLQAVGSGMLRGITDVKIPMIAGFIAYWIIGLPLCYIFGFVFGYGIIGIWVALSIALTSAAILFNLRFYKKIASIFDSPE